jgi:hypothetical protein
LDLKQPPICQHAACLATSAVWLLLLLLLLLFMHSPAFLRCIYWTHHLQHAAAAPAAGNMKHKLKIKEADMTPTRCACCCSSTNASGSYKQRANACNAAQWCPMWQPVHADAERNRQQQHPEINSITTACRLRSTAAQEQHTRCSFISIPAASLPHLAP